MKSMKRGIFCILICGLMLAGTMLPLTAASYQQKIPNNGSETQKESIFGDNHSAFIIGYFNATWWEGDRCILFVSGRFVPHDLPVMYITRFGFQQLGPDRQIQLVNPKYCFIGKDFVIGFSKIFFPESKISMHIIDYEDEFNTVRWAVDNIEGDKVWGCNMRADVYSQNGSRYSKEYSGPYKPAYLTVGDEFKVTTYTDGVYQVKITDVITGRVLFTSPFIHF
jgi:hypothetical protein